MSTAAAAANTKYRFGDGGREPCAMRSPIGGFSRYEVKTLSESLRPLLQIVPRVATYRGVAQDGATNVIDGLTPDQSAAIALYTMEWTPFYESIYYLLNTNLRDENRDALKPWFLYLKLLITALQRLPRPEGRIEIYRGINFETVADRDQYQVGKKIIWWGFSSCSADRMIAERDQFVGEGGLRTLLIIDSFSGVDIKNHSHFKKEKEILLLPATKVKVVNREEDPSGLFLIYLEEIPSRPGLLEKIPTAEEKRKFFQRPVPPNAGAPNPPPAPARKRDRRPELLQALGFYKPGTPATLTGETFGNAAMQTIIEHLIISRKCPTLIFRENNLTHIGAQVLAKTLSANQTLLELYIVENKIGVEGVRAIAGALANPINTNLRKLSLVAAGFKSEGLRHIARMLETNKTLSELSLPQNKIGDVGFQDLMSVLAERNRTLRVLSLEWNQFGSTESFTALNYMLHANKTLSSLNVESCKWSNVGIRELRIAAKNKNNFQLSIS